MSSVTEKETAESTHAKNSPDKGGAAGSGTAKKAAASKEQRAAVTGVVAGQAAAGPGLQRASGIMVYAGPDLPGIAAGYAVYSNGLPEPLKEYIKDKPVFKSLIVPVEKLAQLNAELGRAGSAASVLYRKACEIRDGRKKKGGNANGL